MIIGIDIDGVLTDIEQWELDYLSKYYLESYNKYIKNPKGYGSYQIFEGTNEEDAFLWNKAIYKYIKEPPRKFASEVIKKLKDENNEIYIITNRSSDLSYVENMNKEQMENIVKNWLKKYNILYDKLIFSNSDKLDVCIKNNIDIMIEDKPKNILKISTTIPVICFNAGYNENCTGINIYRAYSWYDIYYKLNLLQNGLRYIELHKENIDLAIKIQNEIFPNEDASYNYYEFINKIPYRKELIYWLVYDKNKLIGISGLYSILEYPEDAWLGWYGVIEKERNKGYGIKILEDFERISKQKGYKNIRLYTEEENKNAISVYKKFGMVCEKYKNKNEKYYDSYLSNSLIFSKSLTNEKCELWNDKYIAISDNIEKENKKYC